MLLGLLFMVMNYNHPYSETVRQYYATTALMPEVRGRVVDVPAKPNQPVKKGDVLFRINPEPFEDAKLQNDLFTSVGFGYAFH